MHGALFNLDKGSNITEHIEVSGQTYVVGEGFLLWSVKDVM